MHELAICQDIIQQLEAIAAQHHARHVSLVKVQIGPLSGVEAHLLSQAFPIASAGSIADKACLVTETLPVRVECKNCGHEAKVKPNRLICPHCGDWQTRLLSGDELLLASVELEKAAARYV